jgi:hypothetical protein
LSLMMPGSLGCSPGVYASSAWTFLEMYLDIVRKTIAHFFGFATAAQTDTLTPFQFGHRYLETTTRTRRVQMIPTFHCDFRRVGRREDDAV